MFFFVFVFVFTENPPFVPEVAVKSSMTIVVLDISGYTTYFSSTPLKNKEYRSLEYCKSSILFPWSVMYKFLNTLKAFLKSLCASGYKINKSKHRSLIKYVQICCSCCTNEGYINKLAEYSGNNLGINNGSFKF